MTIWQYTQVSAIARWYRRTAIHWLSTGAAGRG
jgi:hypothetical protein